MNVFFLLCPLIYLHLVFLVLLDFVSFDGLDNVSYELVDSIFEYLLVNDAELKALLFGCLGFLVLHLIFVLILST